MQPAPQGTGAAAFVQLAKAEGAAQDVTAVSEKANWVAPSVLSCRAKYSICREGCEGTGKHRMSRLMRGRARLWVTRAVAAGFLSSWGARQPGKARLCYVLVCEECGGGSVRGVVVDCGMRGEGPAAISC